MCNAQDVREKVHPGVALVLGTLVDLGVLLTHGSRHDEELLAGLRRLNAADALPHLERLERLALVHEVARTLRQEEHAVMCQRLYINHDSRVPTVPLDERSSGNSPEKHNGGKDKRRPEDVSPVARHLEEHRRDSIPEDLAEGNVELVQRDEVASDAALDCLGDVHGDGTALETDTEAEDDAGRDNHACAPLSACIKDMARR